MDNLKAIVSRFPIVGEPLDIRPVGDGHINDTLLVVTSGKDSYILQRKNRTIFTDVPAMMQNIDFVTSHIRAKIEARGGDSRRECMTQLRSLDGELFVRDSQGEYWTLALYIPDTVSYSSASTDELCYQGGSGIGRFGADLADLSHPLTETIKGFHNLRSRFEQWDSAIAADRAGRLASVRREVEWIQCRRSEMMLFWGLVEDGTLPRRVTHNDTKINNILFDVATRRALCVIDLDTVMPGTALNDFGDAVRTYTNTGEEDDTDISRVTMNISHFRALAEGFLSSYGSHLTAVEREWLPFGGRFITYEQTLRFLMDYINGDTYYKTAYVDHNLVRTRAQYALLQSIEAQWDDMRRACR